jgi:hypothetical protein
VVASPPGQLNVCCGARGRRLAGLALGVTLAGLALGGSPAPARAQLAGGAGDSTAVIAARLQRADSTLAAVEAELRLRDERVGALADAARRGATGGLVVLLRVDPASPRTLASATLSIGGADGERRVYYTPARDALAAGAADELHRGRMLAVPHALTLELVMGSQRLSRTYTVLPAGDGRMTYVQFMVRGGELEGTSWSGAAVASGR